MIKCARMLVRQGSEQVFNWAGAQPWRKPHPLQTISFPTPPNPLYTHEHFYAPEPTTHGLMIYVLHPNFRLPLLPAQSHAEPCITSYKTCCLQWRQSNDFSRCIYGWNVFQMWSRYFSGISQALAELFSYISVSHVWEIGGKEPLKLYATKRKQKELFVIELGNKKQVESCQRYLLFVIHWFALQNSLMLTKGGKKSTLISVDHFLPFFPWST